MQSFAPLIIQIISFYHFSLQSVTKNMIIRWRIFKICQFQEFFASFRFFSAILKTISSIFWIYDLMNIAEHRQLDRVKGLREKNPSCGAKYHNITWSMKHEHYIQQWSDELLAADFARLCLSLDIFWTKNLIALKFLRQISYKPSVKKWR